MVVVESKVANRLVMTPVNHSKWEQLVLDDSYKRVKELIGNYINPGIGSRQLPKYQFDINGNHQLQETAQILSDIQSVEASLQAVKRDQTGVFLEQGLIEFKQRRSNFYRNFARDLVRRGRLGLIPSFSNTARTFFLNQNLSPVVADTWRYGLATIFALTNDSNEYVVGTKGGIVKKNITIPLKSPGDSEPPIMFLSRYYLMHASLIGQREAAAVPTDLIHPKLMEKPALPESRESLEQILTRAYYDHYYDLPDEGADILLRGPGDVTAMTLVQDQNFLFAKIDTPFGQGGVFIHLDEAASLAPGTNWHNLVALVYGDFVSKGEIVVGMEKHLGGLSFGRGGERFRDSNYIYIPRRRHKYLKNTEWRKPTEPRLRPHWVDGHGGSGRGNGFRRMQGRGISEEQRKKAQDWSEQTGIPIPQIDELKIGETWVLPHPVNGGEVGIKASPTFIRRNLSRDLFGDSPKLQAKTLISA
jgi:hypothetical protein